MIIDSVCKKLIGQDFDKDGERALAGKVNHDLLNYIVELDSFVDMPFPKTTGREYYSEEFTNKILDKSESLGVFANDVLATVSEYTVYCISKNIKSNFEFDSIKEYFVSGGGALNNYIMNRLQDEFHDSKVTKEFPNGITVENKEAVLFAMLGYYAKNGYTNNIPSATGAKRKTILGKICPAA